jgi:hypothetical protein
LPQGQDEVFTFFIKKASTDNEKQADDGLLAKDRNKTFLTFRAMEELEEKKPLLRS